MATQDDMQAELERLRAENQALKEKAQERRPVYLKVSDRGGVSLYGLGRFPLTLYVEQWDMVLGMADEIRAFLAANAGKLKRKD